MQLITGKHGLYNVSQVIKKPTLISLLNDHTMQSRMKVNPVSSSKECLKLVGCVLYSKSAGPSSLQPRPSDMAFLNKPFFTVIKMIKSNETEEEIGEHISLFEGIAAPNAIEDSKESKFIHIRYVGLLHVHLIVYGL